MTAPQRLDPNELLGRHGPGGWLIVRLQRYALAGWIAFFVLLALFVLLVFVSTLAPKPVVAVNAAGQVLGRMEYLGPDSRSDAEIRAAVKRFLDDYLSLNSTTIFDDYAAALNMMSPALRRAALQALRRDRAAGGDYLMRVRAARSRSRLTFDAPPGGVRILERRGLAARVRARGEIHIRDHRDRVTVRPFDMTLNVAIVARTMADTAGLEVTGIRER
ncbi:MAG: hypothetical protein ACYDHY_16825 [Acidiferrobacterales bacterium]